jgi:hypothetical protein
MAGLARKIALSIGILGLGIVVAASVRALHKGASREVHLSSSDGALRTPGVLDPEPAALAFDGEELVYLTHLDSAPVTLRAVARRDLGTPRVVSSRTIAPMRFSAPDWDGSLRPEILVSPGRYLVTATAAHGARGGRYLRFERFEPQLQIVDRRSGAVTRLSTGDAGQKVGLQTATATPGGFVVATNRDGASDVLVVRDGETKAGHHAQLEAAVRDAHTVVCADQDGAVPRRVGEVLDVVAVGNEVVLLTSADGAHECDPAGETTKRVGRKLFAAPWAGGPVRSLQTFEATDGPGTRFVGATKTAVWLRVVSEHERADRPPPIAFVLVPLDGGPDLARLSVGDGPYDAQDTNAAFVAGGDLVLGRWTGAGAGELVRHTPDGRERSIRDFRGQPLASSVRAWDAREVLVVENGGLVRLAL